MANGKWQIFLIFVVEMRRLKKKIYYGACAVTFATLAVVRQCAHVLPDANPTEEEVVVETPPPPTHTPTSLPKASATPHPIRSVHSYQDCFPDVQDVQIVAAHRWGVRPVRDRAQAEERKSELVFVGSNPYYQIDRGMSSSIPYLVPRAALLLQDIGRSYLDSLFVKGVPLHRIIVTSVLRSEEDVRNLQKRNGNASPESCHRFGTTFDIAYNRYAHVDRPVTNDTLKWVLSEVLRDIRQQGRCYIRYEVKQGCFHITTR